MIQETLENHVLEIYDRDHLINRLYVHMDLLMHCNQRCSYCYAFKYNKKHVIVPPKKVSLILEALSHAKLPVFLGIQGGEPSLYPLKTLINSFELFLQSKTKNRVYFTTNFYKPSFWFDLLKCFSKSSRNKLYLLVSFHPEYVKDEISFIYNLYEISHLVKKVRINVMLYPPYLSKCIRVLKFLLNDMFRPKNLEIHPHFLYIESIKFWPYKNDIWYKLEFLKYYDELKYIKVRTTYQDLLLSDYEYFRYGFHKTVKHMFCYHNNFEIFVDGVIKNICMNKTFDLSYIVNLEQIKPIVCPNEQCCCDGLVKQYKRSQYIEPKFNNELRLW